MKKNKLFDELSELEDKIHEIELSNDIKILFGANHISINSGLILSSFLPIEIQREFNKYIHTISMWRLQSKLVDDLTKEINESILDKLNN